MINNNENYAYHHQEDDYMPVINNQVDLSYWYHQGMIGSYLLLLFSVRKGRLIRGVKISQQRIFGVDTFFVWIQPYFQ